MSENQPDGLIDFRGIVDGDWRDDSKYNRMMERMQQDLARDLRNDYTTK